MALRLRRYHQHTSIECLLYAGLCKRPFAGLPFWVGEMDMEQRYISMSVAVTAVKGNKAKQGVGE